MNNLLILNDATLFVHNYTTIKSPKNLPLSIHNWLQGISTIQNQATIPTSGQKRKRVCATTITNAVVHSTSATSVDGFRTKEPSLKRSKLEVKEPGQHAYGGFAEMEGGSVDRQAALTRTIKTPAKDTDGSCQVKFTKRDLPLCAAYNNTWHRHFLPTYIQYLARSGNPWSTNVPKHLWAMQTIWNDIYGWWMFYRIKTMDAVFYLAEQRASEWRNGFASTALAVIQDHFETLALSNVQRKQCAFDLLEHQRFLYAEMLVSEGKVTPRGTFRNRLVLFVFGSHFSSVHGALEVFGDGPKMEPVAALALSAAAVERGLRLWRDRYIIGSGPVVIREDISSIDFNRTNWGRETNNYARIIRKLRHLSEEKLQIIVAEAKAIVEGKLIQTLPNSGELNADAEWI